MTLLIVNPMHCAIVRVLLEFFNEKHLPCWHLVFGLPSAPYVIRMGTLVALSLSEGTLHEFIGRNRLILSVCKLVCTKVVCFVICYKSIHGSAQCRSNSSREEGQDCIEVLTLQEHSPDKKPVFVCFFWYITYKMSETKAEQSKVDFMHNLSK